MWFNIILHPHVHGTCINVYNDTCTLYHDNYIWFSIILHVHGTCLNVHNDTCTMTLHMV